MQRWVVLLLLFAAGCVRDLPAPLVVSRGLPLLKARAKRETLRIAEVLKTLEVDTDQERTPHVVATGTSELFEVEGASVSLAGDAEGTRGFRVDNFLLLEVHGEDGARLARAAVGFVNGLQEGKNRIDLMSRGAFVFEAREVNLRGLLPERGKVRITATALDTGGVGSVSDVYLFIEPRRAQSPEW